MRTGLQPPPRNGLAVVAHERLQFTLTVALLAACAANLVLVCAWL